MRKFLLEISAFVFIAVIFVFIMLIIRNYKVNNIDYKIEDTVTTLFSGDSHVTVCVNDTLIKNSKNISLNSESYYYSFYKLKRLLKNNQSIKKLYLGFSYHNLASYYNDVVFGNRSKEISPTYFYLLPASDKAKMVLINFKNVTFYIKDLLRSKNSLGSYQNTFYHTSVNKSSMDKRLQLQYYSNSKEGFSCLNLEYLRKIIHLCQSNKIQLILFTTPMHPYYKNHIPIQYIHKYDELINKFRLPAINFNTLKLDDSCFLPDGDHVSRRGSIIISKYLATLN